MLRDSAAAEEVTATAFERAYRKRARFNPRRGSARAWLFGIARNAALDELRRRGRQAKLVDGDLADLSTADPSDRSGLRLALAGAVGTLAAGERELIALKFFAGLSNAEIRRRAGDERVERRHETASHREQTEGGARWRCVETTSI